MFPTLKLKLVVALGLVVLLTVGLTGLGSFYMLRDQYERAERERVSALSLPIYYEVLAMLVENATTEEVRARLIDRARDINVRFLLVDQAGRIVADTRNELIGEPFDPTASRQWSFRESAQSSIRFRSYEDRQERQVFIEPWPGRRIQVGTTTVGVAPREYQLLMGVPDDYLTGAWRDLLPRLGIPALIALLVSGVIAYLLARSIARPVVEVTHASEAMARGLYHQRIPVEGRDEIGRLAASFNAMATQVGRSHQMMKDLVANVAHELKTPLTSIQGFSQALVEGAATTPEDRANAARIINDEADRMRRLVEDLLYLSQLESGQLRMEMGPVDLAALLRDAAERITWQLQDRQTAFRLNIAPGLGTISGDKRRLEQVLANLLDNAARHTPPGGTIALQGVRRDDAAVLSVTNTGSFIPPDVLPRVFERFYRADAHRTRDGRHGGLGLAIAAEIATAHQGRIEASSDPKTGTEFRLILPVPRESATVEAPRAGLAARLPLRRAGADRG